MEIPLARRGSGQGPTPRTRLASAAAVAAPGGPWAGRRLRRAGEYPVPPGAAGAGRAFGCGGPRGAAGARPGSAGLGVGARGRKRRTDHISRTA